jgi:hypothetical protein
MRALKRTFAAVFAMRNQISNVVLTAAFEINIHRQNDAGTLGEEERQKREGKTSVHLVVMQSTVRSVSCTILELTLSLVRSPSQPDDLRSPGLGARLPRCVLL